MASVNYEFVLEMEGVRHERTNKRMFIIIIVLIITLVSSNLGWLYYESQYETATTTSIKAEQQADGNSNNYIIGGDYDACDTESNDN